MADDPVASLMAALKKNEIEYLRFEMADMAGVSRSKTVPIDKVESYARRGLNFYGGVLGLDTSSNVVPASGLHGDRNYADQALFPDPDSLRIVPWLEKTASVICLGYWDDGEPQRAAPRWLFSELVKRVNALGYDTVGLIADAIKRAGSEDPAKIRDALATTKDYPGITGSITYPADSRVPQKTVTMIGVKDQKLTLAAEVTPSFIPEP